METAVQQKSDDDLQALIDDSPAAPVESSPPPAPSNDGSDIDALLREFQEKTAQPEPADNVSENQETTNDDLDRLLAEINGPDPKVAELQGQIDAFKASEFQAQERQAALKWAADLQEVVSSSNPNCESDFVVRELKVLSADNPGL